MNRPLRSFTEILRFLGGHIPAIEILKLIDKGLLRQRCEYCGRNVRTRIDECELEDLIDTFRITKTKTPEVNRDRSGYVYILRLNGAFKIGKAKEPGMRFKVLGVGQQVIAHLIQCEDYHSAERKLHKIFEHRRKVPTELFKLTTPEVDALFRIHSLTVEQTKELAYESIVPRKPTTLFETRDAMGEE